MLFHMSIVQTTTTSMKPDTEMMFHQNPSIDEYETDVLLVTTVTPPPTTTMRSFLSIIIVAGMMVVTGGVVWMRDGETAAEGLAVATQDSAPCLPATDTFQGKSLSDGFNGGHREPFETCFQFLSEAKYCWSKSYYCDDHDDDEAFPNIYYQCTPEGDGWKSIDANYVNPVTHPNSCGTPCQDMHQVDNRCSL
jgi:hypothetical protein